MNRLSTIIILSTASKKEEAEQIALTLVEEKLAACVNVVPNLRSFYRWEGRVQQDEEFLMIIKTVDTLFQNVSERIKMLHSYEAPEIIAVPIIQGSEEYLGWIGTSVR